MNEYQTIQLEAATGDTINVVATVTDHRGADILLVSDDKYQQFLASKSSPHHLEIAAKSTIAPPSGEISITVPRTDVWHIAYQPWAVSKVTATRIAPQPG